MGNYLPQHYHELSSVVYPSAPSISLVVSWKGREEQNQERDQGREQDENQDHKRNEEIFYLSGEFTIISTDLWNSLVAQNPKLKVRDKKVEYKNRWYDEGFHQIILICEPDSGERRQAVPLTCLIGGKENYVGKLDRSQLGIELCGENRQEIKFVKPRPGNRYGIAVLGLKKPRLDQASLSKPSPNLDANL